MKAPFEMDLDENLVNDLNSYDLMVKWLNIHEIEETKVYEFTFNSTQWYKYNIDKIRLTIYNL